MSASLRYSCRNTSWARSSAASRRLSMRNPMLKTEPWCARTRAAKASVSPARACESRESGMEGAGFIDRSGFRIFADLGNVELSFEVRELVDVDVTHDADHGELAWLRGDHRESAGLVVFHADEHVHVFLGVAFVDRHHGIPLRPLELVAHGVDVGLAVAIVAVELVAAHLDRLDVVEHAQVRVGFALVLRDGAGDGQQEST